MIISTDEINVAFFVVVFFFLKILNRRLIFGLIRVQTAQVAASEPSPAPGTELLCPPSISSPPQEMIL